MREWLKKIRRERGLILSEMARRCGISASYYWKIENGKRNVPVGTAKRIAEVLGFDWRCFYENET